jgi:rSAM/selenodomain-associated transferase 2
VKPVSGQCRFSIIIPVLHESQLINTQLETVKHLVTDEPFEIIVVDGSPTLDTLQVVKDKTIITCSCRQGRGRQMNAGAAKATGDILVFLHADTILPTHALLLIQKTLQNKQLVGGAFSLQIQSQKLILRVIAAFSTFRSQITRAPYGDQVIFLRKSYFDAIGGYKDIPLMEDVELMRRIRKNKRNIIILPTPVITSARRWDQEGLYYTAIRDNIIIFLYWCRIPAEKLSKFYPWQTQSIENSNTSYTNR